MARESLGGGNTAMTGAAPGTPFVSKGAASSASSTGAPAPSPQASDRQGAPPENPRSKGHSPAIAAREQQQAAPAQEQIEIDGAKFESADVREAIAHKIEAEARKAALPSSPDA